jgi:hypothetical protein
VFKNANTASMEREFLQKLSKKSKKKKEKKNKK